MLLRNVSLLLLLLVAATSSSRADDGCQLRLKNDFVGKTTARPAGAQALQFGAVPKTPILAAEPLGPLSYLPQIG